MPDKENWVERRGSKHLRNASSLLSAIKSEHGWNVALKKFDKQAVRGGELLGLSRRRVSKGSGGSAS